MLKKKKKKKSCTNQLDWWKFLSLVDAFCSDEWQYHEQPPLQPFSRRGKWEPMSSFPMSLWRKKIKKLKSNFFDPCLYHILEQPSPTERHRHNSYKPTQNHLQISLRKRPCHQLGDVHTKFFLLHRAAYTPCMGIQIFTKCCLCCIDIELTNRRFPEKYLWSAHHISSR